MRVTLLLSLALVFCACGSSEPTDPAPTPAHPSAAPSPSSPTPPTESAPEGTASPAPADEPPPAARQAIPEAEARALLDAWLAAQNGGDFAAYSALYASRFSGVKRSEDRVRRYAHDGWLDNRRRMFRRPQEVAASDVTLRATADMVEVRFTQSWASRSYRDVGPKRLLLVREGDALRIAREEMLASTRTDAAEPPAAELRVALRFMLQAQPGRVELAAAAPDQAQAWSSGRPRLLASQGGTVVVAKRVRRGALPAALRALVGRSYRVYGERGEVCEGAVTGLSLVRRYTPHFGQLDGWNAGHLSPARRAVEAWETGSNGGVLVGELTGARACAGGLFALPADAPRVSFAPGHELPPADGLRAAMESAARATSEYTSIQRDFASNGGEGQWTASEGASASVRRFGSGAGVATLEWSAGDGCGDFEGAMLLPFSVRGDVVEARPIVPPMFGARPVAVFDWKADGEPALLVRDALGDLFLLSPDGGVYHVSVQRNVPYFDCPC